MPGERLACPVASCCREPGSGDGAVVGPSSSSPLAAVTKVSSAFMICAFSAVTWGGPWPPGYSTQLRPRRPPRPARARQPQPVPRPGGPGSRPRGRPVTRPRRAPSRTRRPAATPLVPGPRQGEKEPPETTEPYELPFPDDRWPLGERRPFGCLQAHHLAGPPGQGLLGQAEQQFLSFFRAHLAGLWGERQGEVLE